MLVILLRIVVPRHFDPFADLTSCSIPFMHGRDRFGRRPLLQISGVETSNGNYPRQVRIDSSTDSGAAPWFLAAFGAGCAWR